MTNEHNEQAILLLHTLRTGYICDPNECKFTKGDENCILCECDNYHDALAFAIECVEKQTPKKPDRITRHRGLCANCLNTVFSYSRYCDVCGQRQDWKEVEVNGICN